MKHTYVFIGTLSKDIPVGKFQEEIANKIALQQTQFNNGTGDNDPANIEVTEFAYTNAEPNCWLIFARWRVK